jgi:hypothetical protein
MRTGHSAVNRRVAYRGANHINNLGQIRAAKNPPIFQVVPILVPTILQSGRTVRSKPAQLFSSSLNWVDRLQLSAGFPICASSPPAPICLRTGPLVLVSMAIFPRDKIYWYKFYFAAQLIRESSRSTSKTVAENAENQRRRKLE